MVVCKLLIHKRIILKYAIDSQEDGVEVVGDHNVAAKCLFGLGGEVLPTGGKVGVLAVIEQQILHIQLCGYPCRVEHGAVVLLVGPELLVLRIEAESLAQQPVATAHIALGSFVVGFIAQTGHPHAVGERSGKTELFLLGRTDVEEIDLHVVDLNMLAIGHLTHHDAVAYGTAYFLVEHQVAHGEQGMARLIVTIDGERRLILTLVDEGRNFANHPDDTHDVVGVGVGNKQVMNILKGNACPMELPEDAVAATCIDHEQRLWRVQAETGVVAAHTHGVACA